MDNNIFVRSVVLAIGLYAVCDMSVLAQSAHHREPVHVSDTVTIDEVVVGGRRLHVSSNSVHTHLDREDIVKAMGQSLAAMLEQTSGMSSIQTGTIVAKPVIHGMYGNRILIVNNGARLTGQQWGTDHAPEIDKNGYSGVSVVKGSESVRYGAEAMGGIIVMEQPSLPYGEQAVRGELSAVYGTNGRRYGGVGRVQGTMPWNRSWAWRVQGTWDHSGDRSTARYLLNNTGMRENDLSVATGYARGSWKVEGGYNLFAQKIGVMQSAQMGNEQLLQERISIGQPVVFTPFSRRIDYPHQKIVHHTLYGKASWKSQRWGEWEWQTTYQADNRRENRIRRMNHSDIPTVSLRLQSLQNSLLWQKAYGGWKSQGGVQMVATENHSERGTGVVPIIPNYTEVTLGLYGIQRYTAERWSAEAGVRLDGQRTEADGYDWTSRHYGGSRQFTNFTYSAGAHWHPDSHWTLTTHAGVAWRAPHVYELYSNGNELSSGMFVRGDSTLRSEQSYKWVVGTGYKSKYLDVQLDGYLQWINHYIYDEPSHRNIVVVSGAYPLFEYKQTSAFFRGVDLDVTVRPLPTLSYRLVTAWVWANERQTGNYLPYIPSTRFTHKLVWTPQIARRLHPRIGVSHRFVARQTRYNPASDLTETTPPAYSLFGFEASVAWKMQGGRRLELSVMGDNVLNKQYKEYTNRSRYYAHDMGRDIRCIVTWNF